MAEQVIYNNSLAETPATEALLEPVQPGVKEWAKGAFEQIGAHAREFIEPSIVKIDQIRSQYAQLRGLARLNYQLFQQRDELRADQNFMLELSQKVETAKGDRSYWEGEVRYLQGTINKRQEVIDKLLEKKIAWTGEN